MRTAGVLFTGAEPVVVSMMHFRGTRGCYAYAEHLGGVLDRQYRLGRMCLQGGPLFWEGRSRIKVYEFEVPEEWTDAYYQHNTLWRYFPVREGADGTGQYTFHEWRATQETFYAEAWAFNDDV